MSFIYNNPQHFRNFLNGLKALSEEVEFTANSEGLMMSRINPSRCLISIQKIPSSAFERWNIVEEQKFTLNTTKLIQMIPKYKKKYESIEFSLNLNRNSLDIILRDNGHIKRKKLRILTNGEVPQPKTVFKAHARLVSKNLLKTLKDFHDYENIIITFENSSLTFSQQGDNGSQSITFEKNSNDVLEIRYEEDTWSAFTESNLEQVVKAIQPLNKVVNIDLSTNMPIKIWSDIGVETIEFYLAPIVMNQNELMRNFNEKKTTIPTMRENVPNIPISTKTIWSEKYKPKTLKEIVNQKPIIAFLKNILLKDEPQTHIILLIGSTSTGKTCVAESFINDCAKKWSISDQSILRIDGSIDRGIDDVREKIRHFLMTYSFDSPLKMLLLENIDSLVTTAQKPLYKTLSEISVPTIVIMTTSNTSSIEESLVSVAHSFRLAKLTNQDHLDILGEIARSEELDIRPVDLIRISSENKDIRAMINSMQARWSK